jgi:hypothetical protein
MCINNCLLLLLLENRCILIKLPSPIGVHAYAALTLIQFQDSRKNRITRSTNNLMEFILFYST